MKKFLQKFRYGEKGFTLIELLVVIAILGILAAVAVPNISKFINSGQQEAADTELAIVQTAVIAGMADAGVGTITGSGTTPLSSSHDVTISGTITVGDYIVGGITSLSGSYDIGTDGSVTAHS